jgi:hypothetical protein
MRNPAEVTARELVIAVIEEGLETYIETYFAGEVDGITEGVYYTVHVERHVIDPFLVVALDDEHVMSVTV